MNKPTFVSLGIAAVLNLFANQAHATANNWIAIDGPMTAIIGYCQFDATVLVLSITYTGQTARGAGHTMKFVTMVGEQTFVQNAQVSDANFYSANPTVVFFSHESKLCQDYYSQLASPDADQFQSYPNLHFVPLVKVVPELGAWSASQSKAFGSFSVRGAFVSNTGIWDSKGGRNFSVSFDAGMTQP